MQSKKAILGILLLFSHEAIAQEAAWIRERLPGSPGSPVQAKNLVCPDAMVASQCLQFGGRPRTTFGNFISTTYICESGHSNDGRSCYVGGCGGSNDLMAQAICVDGLEERRYVTGSAPANTVAQVTCGSNSKIIGCHAWSGDGGVGCGINVSADGRTCTSNACDRPTEIRAVCAATDVKYVFDADSANDFVCPAGYVASACSSLHLPSGKGFYFNRPNDVGQLTQSNSGRNPTSCSFDAEMQNYLFCVRTQ